VFLLVVLGWPPLHAVLAREHHFSTWRYGGLGMYAAPDGADREVHVFMGSCGRPRAEPTLEDGDLDGKLGFYYVVEDARLDTFWLPELDSNEQRALALRIKDVRSLSRPGDFERLAAWIDARLSPTPEGSLSILVTQPRLDVRASVAYADVFGFVRERGRWSSVGPLRGPAALSAMIARVGTCP
jgi:hypothetical protein